MAVTSPFFSSLPLEEAGLRWIWPSAELAHPLDDGTAVILERDIGATACQLGPDAAAYRRLYGPLLDNWDGLRHDLLKPDRLAPASDRHGAFWLAGFALRTRSRRQPLQGNPRSRTLRRTRGAFIPTPRIARLRSFRTGVRRDRPCCRVGPFRKVERSPSRMRSSSVSERPVVRSPQMPR